MSAASKLSVSKLPNKLSESLIENRLEQLIQAVLSSAKYRSICPELVARIGRQELDKRANLKEAVKTTKNKLHQVGGAYLEYGTAYPKWNAELNTAAACDNPQALKETCRRILAHHASTRERLPILDDFYTEIFRQLPPVATILDVACGLNPLSLPWMSLPAGVTYLAWDVYADMIGFLNTALETMGVDGKAEVRDALALETTPNVDLALVLKTLPCLEQVDETAGARLLDAIQARRLVVSFPVRSLGGRQKGMTAHYEAQFRKVVEQKGWPIQRLEFTAELVFIVEKVSG